MKRIWLLLSLCGAFVTGSVTDAAAGGIRPIFEGAFKLKKTRVELAGETAREKRTATEFHGVSVVQGITVYYTPAELCSVEVEADKNVLPYVQTTVSAGGVLRIEYDEDFTCKGGIGSLHTKVYVSTPTLSRLTAASAANIVVSSTAQGQKVYLEVSSSGQITGNVACKELTIRAVSSGEVTGKMTCQTLSIETNSAARVSLSGTAGEVTLAGNSASRIELAEMMCGTVSARLASAARAEIGTVGRLNAVSISSAGTLIYEKAETMGELNVSSGGTVRQKE